MNITKAQHLDDYRWGNRILLLIDKNSDTDAVIAQMENLGAENGALTERDLIIFIVTPDLVYTTEGAKTKINSEKLYKDCDLEIDFTGVVLLGKDGGVKMREPFEVAAETIFALIDGMPMRRSEIRNSKGK